MTCMRRVQVALVGAPNVGKSSLVQALSSGLPEVCDYPFTTRSVKMGHFYVDGRRHQARARVDPFGVWRLLSARQTAGPCEHRRQSLLQYLRAALTS